MINQKALLDAYEAFGTALLRPFGIGDVLYRLTDQVMEVLDVEGAGVLLSANGNGLKLLSSSDHHVAAIDEAQTATGDGPVHVAYHDNEQVLMNDVSSMDRWPAFCQAAAARGMRAAAALPMPVDQRRIGALTMYRGQAHEWGDDEIQAGQGMANMASAYVLNHEALQESRTLAGQLRGALDSRIVVEQAKGLLAGRHDIEPNEAFGCLRRHARTQGERLHEVCRRVIAGDLDLPRPT